LPWDWDPERYQYNYLFPWYPLDGYKCMFFTTARSIHHGQPLRSRRKLFRHLAMTCPGTDSHWLKGGDQGPPLTWIRLGAIAVYKYLFTRSLFIWSTLVSLSHNPNSPLPPTQRWNEGVRSFLFYWLKLSIFDPARHEFPDWYKAYPPIAGRPTQVIRNPRPLRRMSTRGFIEPSYEGKLSLMMVVPLDIFYEVLFLVAHTPIPERDLPLFPPPLDTTWFCRLPLIGGFSFCGVGCVAFASQGFT